MRKPDIIQNGYRVWKFGDGVHVVITKNSDPYLEIESQDFYDKYLSIEESKKVKKSIEEAISFAEELEKENER